MIDRLLLRPQKAALEPQKAVTGPGAAVMTWGIPIAEVTRNVHKMMQDAQAVYARGNRWVRRAEMTISSRVGGVPWHLEVDGETVTDESPPNLKAIRDLFEKPLPDYTYPAQPKTRRELWGLTSRHMGLCNVGYWYLDEIDAAVGWPQRIFYIRPDRLTAEDEGGRLKEWTLDKTESGGTTLSIEQVIPFYLDPPDRGYYGHGLVESIWSSTGLPNAIDTHALDSLGTGGRLPGLYAPKEGGNGDEVFDRMVTDLRTIKDLPGSAKRDIVARAPIEFTPTAADMSSLVVTNLAAMSRDDTLAHWGVPLSTIGGYTPAGMNSGETRKYDEAALWQNAVHFRLAALWETIQYRLLDRWQAAGLNIQLVIDEPTFDDDAPKYELAQKALNLPLRNIERRALLGLDPFGDPVLDNAVWMPIHLQSMADAPPQDETGQKAAPLPNLEPIRKQAEAAMERDVQKVLNRMRQEIAARVTAKASHLQRKPTDSAVWWDEAKWKRELERALKPHAALATELVNERVSAKLGGLKVPDA